MLFYGYQFPVDLPPATFNEPYESTQDAVSPKLLPHVSGVLHPVHATPVVHPMPIATSPAIYTSTPVPIIARTPVPSLITPPPAKIPIVAPITTQPVPTPTPTVMPGP
jgi:hypothetical protein